MRSSFTLAALCCAACDPLPAFTEHELEKLSVMVLDASNLPPNPTNLWADDPAAAELGQKFYFDRRFSGPLLTDSDLGKRGEAGRVACASCHDPANGGADTRSAGPTSQGAYWTGRNAPTVLNAGFLHRDRWVFWDGRKDSLWSHALGPPEAAGEHNGSRLYFAHLIHDLYRTEYEAVFGPMPNMDDPTQFPPLDQNLCPADTDLDGVADSCFGKPGDAVWDSMSPTAQEEVSRVFSNFGKAIEAYERLLVTDDSPFDRVMRGEDENAMSPAAIRGAKLFVGRASCDECHLGPTFSDNRFHNLGVPQAADALHGVPGVDYGRQDGIPRLLADEFNAAGIFSDDPTQTDHLDGLEPTDADLGAFKTPTLRNVALTAPYMHNGAYDTLWDVVVFYAFGGRNDGLLGEHAPAVQPLDLSDDDIHDLVEFLDALTSPVPDHLATAPELP